MNHDLTDLVGNADIAERYGVGRPAVSNWIKRYSDFPAPLLQAGRGFAPAGASGSGLASIPSTTAVFVVAALLRLST